MAALRMLLVVAALTARAHPALVKPRADDVTLSLEPQITGGFLLILIEDEERTTLGHIGRTLVAPYAFENVEGGVEVQVGGVNLTVHTVYDEETEARGINVKWDVNAHIRLEDCLDFGAHHWYGGPMQETQVYPIENAQFTYKGYVTQEEDNGNVMERYWLNSAGQYIYVHPQVPLFVDYNNLQAQHICFGAQIAPPYSTQRNHTELSYDIWMLPNVKLAHQHAVANYLGKPSDVLDYRMVEHPIWSTWAQYGYGINQTNVLEFAEEIRAYGFNNSQLEIDDLWEVCYGSLTVDENKFPNMSQLIRDIKDLGYRVTIWAHPFINYGCEPWYSEALSNGYLVLNEDGSPDTTWWNSNGTTSAMIDFTNPEASEWWSQRVRYVLDTYDIDSVKFDAGESAHSPQIPVQTGDIDLHPHHIVDAYIRTCARFGNMVEVRVGHRTQDLPIWFRMGDRDSIWGLNNGLSTVVTTTLLLNLIGYPFVIPDMIGGNGFNLNHAQADLPTKELFIRWVQVNTFMPSMQYSFLPWNFDNETVEISKKYTELHAEYADEIFAAMQASVDEGTPVNPPLWWLDSTDQEALVIWDEFLLGDTILVAPVLEEGATTRDIYLPAGTWLEEGDPERVIEGPGWIYNYPAPLDILPYFVRDSNVPDAATTPKVATAMLLFGLLFNILG